MTMAAIGLAIAGGGLLALRAFRFIAASRAPEIFVATPLLFVIGIALMMTPVGLLPAPRAVLAGVVLANRLKSLKATSTCSAARSWGCPSCPLGRIDFGLLAAEALQFLGLTVAVKAGA